MGRKGKKPKLLMCLMAASTLVTGILGSVPMPVKAAGEENYTVTFEDCEARIGDTGYETLEEAVANVQAGNVITVLQDCSVSKVLVITADDVTLRSDNTDNPVTISREEEFSGKWYGSNTDKTLLIIKSGSLTTQDIIFDGGAVLDGDFNNSGESWNGSLIYVEGSYIMESGTVLQNNYNEGNGQGSYTAGALHIRTGGNLVMDGGLIQNCYTSGSGGGVQAESGVPVSAVSSTIRRCYAGAYGGGMDLDGEAELSGMTFSGNKAGSTGGAVSASAPITVTDSLIEGNESVYDGGGICTATGHQAHITGCTFTGNTAPRGSAIQTTKGEGTLPLVIRDCTFTGNPSAGFSHAGGVICYGNETGIILSGHIVMEDNLTAGTEPCDINYFYNTGASILLDDDFESDSTFVLGGFDSIKPGRVLIDGTLYHKNASTEQFIWHNQTYCTEKRGENLYLAEAPKTYAVRYNANNNPTGESIAVSDPERYTSEETAVIMDREALYLIMGHFINPGYDLVGWNTEPDGSGIDYVEGQEVNLTEDLYLYAKWEAKKPATVTITYIYNNDTEDGTDSAKVVPGAEIVFPDASRKGYSFKGWYKDEGLTVFAGNAGDTYDAPEEDTTYYAAWEKAEATITFDADGGKMEGGDITAKVDDTITLPACTKDGYEFAGWYDNDTCVGNAGDEYTVTDDVTLKAHYIRKEATLCIVTFDTDGGKEISPVKVEKGQAIRLPEAEKENHIFLGWYTEKEGGEKADTELTVTEDLTLYARWEKEAEKPEERPEATVTFDADGGKMEGGDVIAKVGDTITLPACTKDGYEFAGWYDNDTCVGNAGEEYTVTGDVTLKARYEKKAETTYLITFDPNGGRKAEHIRAAKGEKITLPGTEKSGYVFLGWYTEKEGGILLGIAGDELEVTKDMTVYALWEKENAGQTGDKEPETCKTVFHTEGGTLKNTTLTVIKGAGLYLPLPEKKGFEFSGWYLDKSLTQFAGTYRDVYCITKDMDFYAKWEKAKEDNSDTNDSKDDDMEQDGNAKTYTVKYDANGGTVKESSVKVEKGKTVKLPTAEREGFSFKGWYTDKQVFIGRAGSTYKAEEDITLFAKWEKVTSRDNSEDKKDSDTKTETSGTDTDKNAGTSPSDNRSDKKAGTSTADSNSDEKTDSGAGTQKEPVIQTGRTTPIYLFAVLGMTGVLLAALSIHEGKRSSKK